MGNESIIRALVILGIAVLALLINLGNRRLRKKVESFGVIKVPLSFTTDPTTMAKQWQKQADRSSVPGLRSFYLGMSAMWTHDVEAALQHIVEAHQVLLPKCNGKDLVLLHSNLALAYLQNFDAQAALQVIERDLGGKTDPEMIHALALAVMGDVDGALKILESDQSQLAVQLKEVLSHPYGSAEMVNTLEDTCLQTMNFDSWVYGPVMARWYWYLKRYSLYLNPNRLEILQAEGQTLLESLDAETDLFTSPEARFLRQVLTKVIGRCANYKSFTSMSALMYNITDKIDDLPGSDDFKYNFQEYWRQILFILDRLQGDFPPVQVQLDFIHELIGPYCEKTVGVRSGRCELLIPKSGNSPYAVVYEKAVINDQQDVRLVTRLVSLAEANDMKRRLQSIFEAMDAIGEGERIEPFVYVTLCHPEALTESNVKDFLAQLPDHYHRIVEETGMVEAILQPVSNDLG